MEHNYSHMNLQSEVCMIKACNLYKLFLALLWQSEVLSAWGDFFERSYHLIHRLNPDVRVLY